MNRTASKLRRTSRTWWPLALLVLALGSTAAVVPGAARAADVQVRVLVDVADLIFRSGQPYYYDRGYYQPVAVEYDAWRRPVYYRYAPQPVVIYRPAPRHYGPPPRYAPPPRHHRYALSPVYRVGYGSRHDDGRRHDRGHGHGHGRDRYRGR